jgi:hypothetical protein
LSSSSSETGSGVSASSAVMSLVKATIEMMQVISLA